MSSINIDGNTLNIPETLPMLPVRDIVVFPYMILPLFVGRKSSIKSVEDALSKNRLIFLSSQKDVTEENPNSESVHTVGTVAMILRMRKLTDGRIKILIQGISKARIQKFVQIEPNFEVKIEQIKESAISYNDVEVQASVRNAKEQLEKIIAHGKVLSPDILLVLDEVNDPGRIADLIASNLGLKVSESQKILEMTDHQERLALINQILSSELEVLQVQTRIRNTAKDEMNKSQREYFLREQMRAIKSELGEADSKTEEVNELREKISMSGMPKNVEEEAIKQANRLEKIHPDANEASMIRSYLEWLVDVPWIKETKDNLDLNHAKKVLDEDHYDLEKIKERILEFLAVRQLKNKIKGPILCFAGPPGVGKTSLGKSIARAMGREYLRISLGGVKDEAEIRGHRRTYVGAMPGKIIQALRQVKTKNPIFLLDEIDKLGSDFRGDPSAAMLEVLDPEQNHTFRDNYLNVDYDLSHVMFIATANNVDTIPPALKDRMEMIHLSGYTQQDKVIIAKKHLIDRQITANGISNDHIKFTDEGLKYLITHYTRESGLRNMEREIGSLCRKVAKDVVLGKKDQKTITPELIETFLGPAKFIQEEELNEDLVGICTGLAWTPCGGEVLHIEAIKMKGKGELVLTGQMGSIMQESARAALSYARAHAKELNIDEKMFTENEFHIHIPAGATPKDGPSAGIAMATSLISLLTNTPIRHDLAMTGEITLTGRVLPIGGLKEKSLAALQHGIKDIVIPFQNIKDLTEIPNEFRKKLNFISVRHLDEVLFVALNSKSPEEDSPSSESQKDSSEKTTPSPAA